MLLIYLCAAWIAGIYLGSRLVLPWVVTLVGLIPFCIVPFLPHYRRRLLVLGFCLLIFFGGCLRLQSSLPQADEQHLQFYNDKGPAQIVGMVQTEPETADTTSILQFSATEINTPGAEGQISGKALVRVPRYSEYHYGDVLRLNGRPETPQQFADFDYKNYLAGQEIYTVINYPRIEVLDTGKGLRPLTWVYSLRSHLAQILSNSLPEPQASLAQGMLLGMRADIPHYLTQALSRTGTSHLLAISGLNISMVIGMVLAAGIWLFGRKYSIYIWLALAAIWLYTLLTGMKPPVVRGAIMGSFFLVAEYLGRQRSGLTALGFAAAIMVGIEPHVLWDVSFQLTFLSMAGLVFLSPHLQSWGRKVALTAAGRQGTAAASYSFVSDSLAVTLAAILATWPVIAYYFDVVSLVGLPATFFALLALPGIIITSALASVAGLVVPLLAQLLGWAAWLFVSYFVMVVRVFDALPFSSVHLSNLQVWQIVIYYVALASLATAFSYRRQLSDFSRSAASKISSIAKQVPELVLGLPKKWVISPLLVCSILIWVAVLNMPDDKLHVTILDIGQGDAILVQTPSHQNILIDGGPSPQAIGLELGEKLPFWNRTINLVISTQPQADHIVGLMEVLQDYEVKHVVEPATGNDSATYRQWLTMVAAKRVDHRIAGKGQVIDFGDGVAMEFQHPPSPLLQDTSDDINNNGLVLRLCWNKVSFLLTADIAREAEWYLTAQRANLKSTVLKVAHHGSATSTSPEFLAVVDPEVAVISASSDNRFGLPNREVVDRLAAKIGNERVFLTSEDGAVEFTTDGQRLWVKHDR